MTIRMEYTVTQDIYSDVSISLGEDNPTYINIKQGGDRILLSEEATCDLITVLTEICEGDYK